MTRSRSQCGERNVTELTLACDRATQAVQPPLPISPQAVDSFKRRLQVHFIGSRRLQRKCALANKRTDRRSDKKLVPIFCASLCRPNLCPLDSSVVLCNAVSNNAATVAAVASARERVLTRQVSIPCVTKSINNHIHRLIDKRMGYSSDSSSLLASSSSISRSRIRSDRQLILHNLQGQM